MNSQRWITRALAGLAVLAGGASMWGQGFEAGVYGGGAHFSGGTKAIVGGKVGVAATPKMRFFGEGNLIPAYSSNASYSGVSVKSSAKLFNFGGGASFDVGSSSGKAVPYVAAVAGVGHLSAKASATSGTYSASVSGSTNNVYAGAGLGLRTMVGSKWGIAPEVRYQRYMGDGGGGLLLFTIGAFFGGAK